MSANTRSRGRRALAAVTAFAIALTGAVVLGPAPAQAAYPDTFDPFAISGGFTIYAREDASLGNTETEGSVAVGDTMIKPGGGQFTLVHVVAGTGDYTLPVVDGDPTRLLIGKFSTASGGITAITSAGTTDPNLLGDLKMVQRDGPFQAFARADWLRLNTNPSNVDQTPLIDATHQKYPANASPPAGPAGNSSIYTVDTSATAVEDYVEANREADWEAAAECFADIGDPTLGVGYPVEVAEDYGDRIVLAPLSPDQPNVVQYADIAGTALIQFSPGPEPGVPNPLVIQVPAGTTSVIGTRTDPQGAYSPYIVWDLSAVTGAVTVTAAQGRIDGSIYAPEADVTVNAAPLDGQIIGRNVSTLGGEVHSFMFAGQLRCDTGTGTFRVHKVVAGIDADNPLLDDVVFTVNFEATLPDGDVVSGSLLLPASGDWVSPGQQFPEGTEIEFSEVTPPTIPGYEWVGLPTISPNPLTIGAGETADVTVTNTATQAVGTFSISKHITTADPNDPTPLAPAGTVPVSWVAGYAGTQIGSGTLDVPLDGTPVEPGEDFPVGTRVLFTEDLSGVAPPPGYHWVAAGWAPGRVIVIGDESTVAVTLTNLVAPDAAERTVTVVKEVEGVDDDPRFDYFVSYNIDRVDPALEERRGRQIEVGDPIDLYDLEADTDTLRLAELVPLFDGSPVDVSQWEAPVFRVTVDDVVTEYPTGGFEGDVPLEDAIADIPLPATGDVVVQVVNVRKSGTFEISKRFEGIEPSYLPGPTGFSVTWMAETPDGDSSSGTIVLPANGTPVSPRDESGDPLQFPYGTTITFAEAPTPKLRAVVWGGVVFDPEPLTIGTDDQAVVSATATNEAVPVTGTFLVSKDLVGIDPGELNFNEVTITFAAHLPGGAVESGTFSLPLDGTPTGPVDGDGDPVTFPVGTHVLLGEVPPPDSTLPPGYEWASPTWSPSRWLVIGDDPEETPTVTVTNTAVEYATVSLTKLVEGTTGLIPAGAVYTVDWWLDSEPQPPLVLPADGTVISGQFPVGSILEATEPQVPNVPGATWQDPVWMLDGVVLPVEDNGRVVVPVSSRGDDTIAIELTNTLQGYALLPTTGSTISPVAPLIAFGGILLGVAALLRRRRVA